jgi:biotin carboxyl carrier protein
VKLEIQAESGTYHAEVTEVNTDSGEFYVTLKDESGERSFDVLLLGRSQERYTLRIDNRVQDFVLIQDGDGVFVNRNNEVRLVKIFSKDEKRKASGRRAEASGGGVVKAQMPGRVVGVLKQVGERVETGTGVVVVEAMKMQNEITAPKGGTVVRCDLVEGASVSTGEVLFEIE